jgi:spore germination protein KC
MIGSINDQITRGVLWFRDEIKESVVTVKLEEADGFISMNLIKGRTDLLPKIDGYQLKMTVKVLTMDDVSQNQTKWDLKKLETLKMLEKELAQKIEKRLTETLEKVQKEMKADVIGFAEEFRRKHPEKWKAIKGDWEERFPTVEVTFDIEANVLRTGKGSMP